MAMLRGATPGSKATGPGTPIAIPCFAEVEIISASPISYLGTPDKEGERGMLHPPEHSLRDPARNVALPSGLLAGGALIVVALRFSSLAVSRPRCWCRCG